MSTLAWAALVGYLAGSIPFGLLLTRALGKTDPRTIGSGNIGATNVVRAGGRGLGVLTFALDALKGLVPAAAFGVATPAGWIAGTLAVVGHCAPVWLRFRGGKGVSTVLGVGSVLLWPWGLVAFSGVWVSVLALSRFVALASLAASWSLPVIAWATGRPLPLTLSFVGIGLLITSRHATNLKRLSRGEEPRAFSGGRSGSGEPAPEAGSEP